MQQPSQPAAWTDNDAARYHELRDLGDCYAAVGEDDQAKRCYQQASRFAPEEPEAYVGLGSLALEAGDLEEAHRCFEIARHLEPACREAYAGLAMVFGEAGRDPAAFEMYLKCLELDGDDLVALLGLFQTSCRMGTFAKIIHYLEVFLEGHPDDTAVLFCLATLYAREGQLVRAGRTLRHVLRIEPNKIEAAQMLAQVTKGLARLRPSELATV